MLHLGLGVSRPRLLEEEWPRIYSLSPKLFGGNRSAQPLDVQSSLLTLLHHRLGVAKPCLLEEN